MKRNNYLGLACLTAVITMTGAAQAFSQTDPPRPPRGGNRGPRGQQGPATLVRTPISALVSMLNLTSDQKTAIQKIQTDFQTTEKTLRPPQFDPNGGGTPPDRTTMDANRAKSQQVEKAANDKITALLTDAQKTAAANLLKMLPTLRDAGIPVEVLGDLKLTDAQKTQIAATVKADKDAANGAMTRELHDKMQADVLALLTADQQTTLTAYVKAHPRQAGGGPGGPGGGGPGGGPGGPDGGPGGPPPDGGPGGPPPDGGPGGPPPPAEDNN